MKIGLRGGHSPNCKGAIGILDEQVEVKKIYNELAPMLTNHGYTVIDCNSTAYTVSGELSDGTNKANSSYCDMYITIHMNASNGSGNGTECWLYNASNSTMNSIADRICSNFASNGFQNRGKKYNTGYHDLNASAMPAMIIETLFCDNSGDAGRYKTLGAKGIAALIANGIDNKIPVSAVSGWKTENGKKYYYIDGNKVQGEKYISGKWYYFNPKDNGAMVTGFCDLPTKRVYYGKDGAMVFGEKAIGGKWYYFNRKDGSMVTGFYWVLRSTRETCILWQRWTDAFWRAVYQWEMVLFLYKRWIYGDRLL